MILSLRFAYATIAISQIVNTFDILTKIDNNDNIQFTKNKEITDLINNFNPQNIINTFIYSKYN